MKGVPAGCLRVILALVLVVPLVSSFDPFPNTVYPFIVPKAAVSRILIEIGFGLWCVLAWRDPSLRPWGWSWVMAALGLYLAVGLATALAGESPVRSLWSGYERMTGWIHAAHMAVWAFMLFSVCRTWRDWLGMLRVAGLVAMSVGVAGFMAQGGWAGWLAPYWPEDGRAMVTFGNPVYAGGFAAVGFFICLGLAALPAAGLFGRRKPDGEGRLGPLLWWLVGCGLMLMLLWWSGTRGAMLGLAGGLAVFGLGGLLWPLSRLWRVGSGVLLAGLVCGALLTGYLVLSGGGAGDTLRSGLRDYRPDSIGDRMALAGVAWRGFLERPVLGWGGENYGTVYARHRPAAPESGTGAAGRYDRAHSAPLEELVGGGLVGLLAWSVVWLAIGWAVIRAVRRGRGGVRLMHLCLGAGLAAYFVQGLFLFDAVGMMPQFYLLAAFAAFGEGRRGLPARLGPMVIRWLGWVRRCRPASAVAVCGGVAVAAVGLWFAGAAPLAGAYLIAPVLDPAAPVESAAGALDRVSGVYPVGAVDGAVWYADWAAIRWAELDDTRRDETMAVAVRHLERAAALDPRNADVAVSLAAVYQYLSEGGADREYARRAGDAAGWALRLSPGSREAVYLYIVQVALERGPGYGLAVLEVYLEEYPGYRMALDDLRYRLTAAVELGQELSAP